MEDYKIVDLYWARKESAIGESHRKYGRMLQSLSFSMLDSKEDAEECVNDTYLDAWNAMPTARPTYLGAFLSKITRRISIDRFRYRTRDKRQGSEYAVSLSELGDCVSGGNTTEEIVNVKLLADAIGIYLRTQSREARTAFLARYYFLDPVKEVAAQLGISESKCKTLLYRTRLGLKAYLEKEGFCL